MEYDRHFDDLLVGTPVTGSYTRGVRVYKGVISQVNREDPYKPPYFVKLYKEYPEKSLWFYPWEIQSVDEPKNEKPHLRPDRIPAGFEINPADGQLRRIPRPVLPEPHLRPRPVVARKKLSIEEIVEGLRQRESAFLPAEEEQLRADDEEARRILAVDEEENARREVPEEDEDDLDDDDE